jgi:hypothetical protein
MAEINLDCGSCLYGAEWAGLESGLTPLVQTLNQAQGEMVDSFVELQKAGNAPVEEAGERAKRDQEVTHAEEVTFGSSADVMGVLSMIDATLEEARAVDCSAQENYPASCPRLGRIMLAFPQIASDAANAVSHWDQKGKEL